MAAAAAGVDVAAVVVVVVVEFATSFVADSARGPNFAAAALPLGPKARHCAVPVRPCRH